MTDESKGHLTKALWFQYRPLATLLQLVMDLEGPGKIQLGVEALQQLLESWNSQQELYLSELHLLLEPLIVGLEVEQQRQIEGLLLSTLLLPERLLVALQELQDAADLPPESPDSPSPTG